MENDGLKGLAIASVICGVASWFVLAIALAPMSVIFGVISLRSNDNSTRNWAIIGTIIGVVSVAFMMFMFAVLVGAKVK